MASADALFLVGAPPFDKLRMTFRISQGPYDIGDVPAAAETGRGKQRPYQKAVRYLRVIGMTL